jgi:HlyD family secretion protein
VDEPTDYGNAPTEVGLETRPIRGLDGARENIRRSLPLRIALTTLLLLAALLALTPAFLFFRRPHPVFATATRGDITLTLSASGSVQATIYSASFPIPGILAEINVAPGQRVHKGDTLATLDTTENKAAVTAAQSAVSDAQSGVDAAQAASDQAQTALATAQSSLATQQSYAATECARRPADPASCAAAQAAVARAQTQVDAAQVQVNAAQAQVAAAQSALDNAQSALRAAQSGLASTALAAPHDGIVLTINGQSGDQIAPGGVPFITLADTAQPLATALISYHDITNVEVGELATVSVTQVPGSPRLVGTVVAVTLQPHGAGAQLAYPVSVSIDPESLKGARLLPGMSATITITTRARVDVVTLPVGAIAYARQAAPASGKGLLTAAQIKAALQAAKALRAQVIDSGWDVAHDPPKVAYLIGFTHGKYVAIPVVLGLSDGHHQEIIVGLSAGQKVVSGQRNPFVS